MIENRKRRCARLINGKEVLASEFKKLDLNSLGREIENIYIKCDVPLTDEDIKKINSSNFSYNITGTYDEIKKINPKIHNAGGLKFHVSDANDHNVIDIIEKLGEKYGNPSDADFSYIDLLYSSLGIKNDPRLETKRKFLCDAHGTNIGVNSNFTYMSLKEILEYVDYVAKEISKRTNSDIGKIVLLDKFMHDNFKFETHWDESHAKYDEKYKDVPENKRPKPADPIHYVDYLLKENIGVCSAITPFSVLVLSHPLINIPACQCTDDKVWYNHTWTDVCIDGKWYTADFSHSLWLYEAYPHCHILKKLNSNDIKTKVYRKKDEESLKNINMDECKAYDRNVVNEYYDRFKDVKIEAPNIPNRISEDEVATTVVAKRRRHSQAADNKPQVERKRRSAKAIDIRPEVNETKDNITTRTTPTEARPRLPFMRNDAVNEIAITNTPKPVQLQTNIMRLIKEYNKGLNERRNG